MHVASENCPKFTAAQSVIRVRARCENRMRALIDGRGQPFLSEAFL